jgi:hypothetical protein
VVIGVAITRINGFVQTPMVPMAVDVVYWGIPLPWAMTVIPTRLRSVDWLNFITDLVFCVIIIFTISIATTYLHRYSIKQLAK